MEDDIPVAAGAKKDNTPATSTASFDFESYIANYTGHTKIERLIFIGEHCKELEADAYRVAVDELKKTTNTGLYRQLLEKAGDKLGQGYRLDQAWVDSVDKKAQQTLERLEMDLNGHKTNLIKESIRVSICLTLVPFLTHFRWHTMT